MHFCVTKVHLLHPRPSAAVLVTVILKGGRLGEDKLGSTKICKAFRYSLLRI